MLRYYLNGVMAFLLSLVGWFIPGRPTGPPDDAASVRLDRDVRSGDVAAISSAVRSYQQAVQLRLERDERRAACLEGLGIALRSLFEVRGDIADLNEAVEGVQEALEINPKRVSLAVLLADILRMRFEKSGDHQDLHRAIDILCSMLAECAPQSAECFSILSGLCLCNSLLVRQSTEHLQATRLIPNLSSFKLPLFGSSDYPTASINLAQAYMYHFYGSGAQEDLRRAIEFYYKALQVHNSGTARASCLMGLANAVFARYQHYGEAEELQTALESYIEALEYACEGNLNIQCQIDLAGAYRARFYRDGDDADLQKSFNHLNNALIHCPPGHIHHPSILRSLCWSKLHRVGTCTIDDSQNLINSAKEALNLHPLHHTDRRSCLVLLAGVMYTHFQRVREVEYLNQRVELLAESLSLCSDTHPDHGKACNALADAFLERFEWADERDVADLDRAIQHDNLATKTGSAPPWRYRPKALLFRYFLAKQEDDKKAAKDALLQICRSPYYSYLSRIRMAMQWSSVTRSRGSRFADLTILGYEIAIELRTQLASFSHQNTQTRIGNLAETGDRFATRVAALTLRASGPARAIELLEQSRAVFWTQALQLRSPFDGLPDGLQRELQDTAQKLDAAPNDNFLTEKQVTERKNAAARFESLLQQARSVPGFEGLLLSKSYDQLSAASTNGPVVILLGDDVAMDSCNVIIIRSPGSCPEHFALRRISTYKLKKSLEDFNTARQARESEPTFFGDDDDESHGDPDDSRKMILMHWKAEYRGLLASLWLQIVKPIIDHLGFTRSTGRQRPRIHWCPTGEYAFLPLHAAGLRFKGSDSECTLDYMVSSYTPTIAALLRAQELSERISESANIKVLAVAQPTTPGHTSLPNTEKEIHALESILPSDGLIRLRDNIHLKLAETNSNVTVSQVVEQLPGASILHLACHGHQDQDSPLNSGFALEDGFLTVRKLFEMQTPRARLAFLSACSTAAGYQRLPDEPIHLGTTMLFSGFPNIIATLWTMGDRDGPDVARDVHTCLFDCSLHTWHLDGDGIAYALDEAVRNLINKGVDPSRWATYIHIGP
ncbi:CHAT domain-containing protein [Desarmillaria tabescens]|uniref:CHAT domain-containing protein n=1 Tax=Armillaria tabescens TaxID=1929756 RepID=A0AA39JYZ9_ARMTA|nr:CHAT domain-containing protein [Desarmillaria tabescens]KAK0450375.1 CHAT domain-containing protein [Desarmillaria tabescens]